MSLKRPSAAVLRREQRARSPRAGVDTAGRLQPAPFIATRSSPPLRDEGQHPDALHRVAPQPVTPQPGLANWGLPQHVGQRICRSWIALPSLLQSLCDSLPSVLGEQGVVARWDGFDPPRGPVYADAGQLAELLRLLVRPLTGSDVPGGRLLVQVSRAVQEGALRMTVTTAAAAVADGGGIPSAPATTNQPTRNQPTRNQPAASRSRMPDAPAANFAARARRLAALHHSPLILRHDQNGWGHASLELPAGGPCSVAQAWAQWRERALGPRGRLSRPVRIDSHQAPAPLGSLAASRCSAAHPSLDLPSPRLPHAAAAMVVRLGEATDPRLGEAVDRVLQSAQRLHELVYRTDTRRWILFWDADLEEARQRAVRWDAQIRRVFPHARIVWGDPLQVAVGRGAHRGRIRELVVRDALDAARRMPLGEEPASGWEALTPESRESAERRLGEELERLQGLFRGQQQRLRQQSDALRPLP